ncbi:MAG: hypothetical protein M3Q69_14590, partial [Acidobacteriota bacterium]|nr:hypothetical protein [Acidobacteriota bacterium]
MSSVPSYLPTQFFYFSSALSAGVPLGFCVDPATNNVVLQPWMGGQPEELWQLVDNGSSFALVSALSFTGSTPLYLAVSGSNVVVQADQTNQSSWVIPPQWNNTGEAANPLPDFQVTGAITMAGSTMVLAVQNSDPSSG